MGISTTSLTNSNLLNRLKRFEDQEMYSKEIETLKFKAAARRKPNNVDNRASNDGAVVGLQTKIGDHIRSNNETKLREVTADMNGNVVTANFEIPSKHPTRYYIQWMEHMLAIDDPVIVFTTSDWVGKIMFHKRFLETLQGYMIRGLFVGEDQIILQSTLRYAPC